MPQIIQHNETPAISGSEDQDFVLTQRKEFQVITDGPLTSDLLIRRHRRTPKPWQRHPERADLFVSNVAIDSEDSVLFEVLVDYSTEIDFENPLNKPARIELVSEQRTKFTILDKNGLPLLNTAGDLVGPREVEDSRSILLVEKDLPPNTYPPYILEYNDALNSDSIRLKGRTWEKETLKASGFNISDVNEQNHIEFVTLSFQLVHQRGGWNELFPNQGFNEIIRTGAQSPILNNGERVSEPVFLDKNGKTFRDKEKNLRANLKPKDIVLLNVEDYRALPYKDLPLK